MLYPFKFKPLYKERIWGGRLLEEKMGKKLPAGKTIGESWELSGVQGDISVVANGKLKGNNIEELIEVYMGDLVGEKNYEKFGLEFPLLIKLIDAQDALSIQVHPGDELAMQRHHSYGKTEMWYVVDCEQEAELSLGFNHKVTREEYVKHVADGTLADIVAKVKVKPGDAYFIPAGAIHAIGKGILIAEIQQTSDITYRVFDWNRIDATGHGRELHTELAVDAINFGSHEEFNITAAPVANKVITLKQSKYFTTNVIEVSGRLERDYVKLDSFVVYMVFDGDLAIEWAGGADTAKKGETVLIPASIENIKMEGSARLLESYIE